MDNLPALSRDDRLLILAPHPDDEVLAAGGLLQRAAQANAATRVIFLTDGDNNPWPQRALERRWRVSGMAERARWGVLRRQEALASLRVLGHEAESAEFWALPDQGLTNLLLTAGAVLTEKLCHAVTSWKPSCLVAPALRDRHPDHSAVGVAVDIALRKLSVVGQTSPSLLSYIVHGNPRPGHARVLELDLGAGELAAKRCAILCHRSQTLLSRRRFLAHAQPREPFLIDQGLDDPAGGCSVGGLRRDATGVYVDFGSSISRRILGKPEIHLLAESTTGELRHVCLPVCLLKPTGSLCLSPALLDQAKQHVYVKVRTRFGFYDAVGWHRQSGFAH